MQRTQRIVAETSLATEAFVGLEPSDLRAAALGTLDIDLQFDHVESTQNRSLEDSLDGLEILRLRRLDRP